MPSYPEPPNNNDIFWFVFGGFFAILGVLTRIATSGARGSPMKWLLEALSVGFWGGLAGWIIAYYTTLETPVIAGVSAVFGHMGHNSIVYFVDKFIGTQIGGNDGRKR